jgi:hypothetical protein
MSNFVRQRGFLDPNRLLRAPLHSNVSRVGQPNDAANVSNRPQMGFPNIQQDASNISQTDIMGNMNRGGEFSSNTQVLWGTNINTNDISNKLKEFLTSFMIMQEDDQMDLGNINDDRYTQEPLYIQKLKTISETEEFTLDVDCEHVYRFNP